MKLGLAAIMTLAGLGSAVAADAFDAIYVSNIAVCERADESDMLAVLFDLNATAVAPRQAIWVGGEMSCQLFDATSHPSPIAETAADVEIYATARCYGPYIDFIDRVAMATTSQNINLDNGDTNEVSPDKLEIMSMRADMTGPEQAVIDGYDGIFTRCDALTAADFTP